MPDSNHPRLRALFEQALDQPAAERPAFLATACRGDTGLQQRLVAMLAAASDDRFLSAPTGQMPPPGASADPPAEAIGEGPGSRIGPYTLRQQIGEGGFGLVFLAEQTEPVARKVALKVIKVGMDTRQVVARFEQERQALALMDHPNIARVLDAGATAAGRPYFVMELVKGRPIVDYCDSQALTVDERLALFAQVCSAVQHAHGKGIIHRDIKPSNVLVATSDGRPLAKVIDFGIAKATAQKLTEKTLFTEHQQIIGTLQYMSPEQAEGSLDIDTRTDVYSLGVLLYELLTGSTPFDKKTIGDAMLGELRRLIREVDPPRPSTRLSDSHDTLASVAAQRRIEPKRLGLLLRGDLDWIVMRALEKDRTRRYGTASDLAADIQRHLQGDAVVAAPPSASYRLRKFVRRHRALVMATVATGTALLLGVIAFAWQAHVAHQQRDRAEVAERAANDRATELQIVADFQAGMLAQVDPARAGGELTQDVRAKLDAALAKAGVAEAARATAANAFQDLWRLVNATDVARELIDRTILKPAIPAIAERFVDQPAVAAQLRQTLASRYLELGLYDAALLLQKEAVAGRRAVLGDLHPDTLESISELGTLLKRQSKPDEAEPYYLEVLAKRRAVLGEEHPDTLVALGNLGILRQAQGKLGEAEALLREALTKQQQVLGDEHRRTAHALLDLALLLQQTGKLAEAELLCRSALEKHRRLLGEEHPDTLRAIVTMGFLRNGQDDPAGAEPYYREALATYRRVVGEEHPSTLNAINNMGAVLRAQGRMAEAEACYREALEKHRRTLGDDHRSTLNSLNNVGMLLMTAGKFAEAEPYLRETLAKRRRLLGEDHPSTLISLTNMGGLFLDQKKPAEAEPFLREALEKHRRVLGPEHRNTLNALCMLGEMLEKSGRLAEAEAVFRDVSTTRRRVLGEDHIDTLLTAADLASVLLQSGRHADAATMIEACAERCVAKLGLAHRHTLASLDLAAKVFEAWNAAEPDQQRAKMAADWRARAAEAAAPPRSGK